MSEEQAEEMVEDAVEPTSEADDNFDIDAELNNRNVMDDGDIEDSLDEEEPEETTETTEESSEETTEATTEEVEKFTLKIDGEEQEFTLDELKAMASKAGGADKRFTEAAEGRRKLQEVVSAVGDDPWNVLKKMGKDPIAMAESLLYDHYKLESMTDEEKRIYNIEKENKQYKQQMELSQRQQKEKALAEATEKAKAEYEKQFTEALEKVKIPKTQGSLKRMADYVQQGLQLGAEITVSEAAELVAEDLLNDSKELLSSVDTERLEEILGKDMVKKLKKHELSKIKTPEDNNRASDAPRVRKKKAPKMKSLANLFETIESSL